MKKGWCRFGATCKYSHDTTTTRAQEMRLPGGPQAHGKPPNRLGDSKLRDWKRLLSSANHKTLRPHYSSVTRFFALGLQLMDGDIGASQEAIKELASEAGLAFVKAVTDWHIQELAGSDDIFAQADLWREQISPLFRLLTHDRLVESNIHEQEVATIYSFFVGVNASRLARVFNFVLGLVQIWDDTGTTEPPLTEVLELSLSVLSHAVDCMTTNIINDDFQNVVQRFSGTMEANAGKDDDFLMLRVSRHLESLQRRLGFGKTFPQYQRARAAPLAHETFKLKRDLPGHLSADGPRHDNDHANIADIRIMPTYEEIMSPRSEYLPTTDASQWHLPGVVGRFDREFRLLREDTIGQLRNAAHSEFDRIRNPGHRESRQPRNSVRIAAYDGAVARHITVDDNRGLEVTVRCEQPGVTRNMNDRTRRDWWERCKRLQAGALTCVLDARGMVQFFVVADSTLRGEKKDRDAENGETNTYDLSSDQHYLYVRLNLAETSDDSAEAVLRWYHDSSPAHLVEFPGVLLASFKHTLEALQQLSGKPDIPFADLIAPENPGQETNIVMSPPLFARARDFEFDLTCLALEDGESFVVKTRRPPGAQELSRVTGLDTAQSESILNTLRREVSLIQGPPGTGKSYTGEKLIQGLLANKDKAKLGPIICVCYTNHALDQLLEHLLDAGITGIIRMGSRSKSERLEKLNLRFIAKEMNMTKAEKGGLWEFRQKQKEVQALLTSLIPTQPGYSSKTTLSEHLETYHEQHYNQLFGIEMDEEGFQVVRSAAAKRDPVGHWLDGGSNQQYNRRGEAREIDVLLRQRLFDLTHQERDKLYEHWQKEIQDRMIEDILEVHREHEHAKKQRDLIRQEIRHRCLQQAEIIGVTTTGMARDLHLLRKLRSKIVVCEEAGEVLEAHTLTALLPSVEQLILIGDHRQLRPQIQNYNLQSTNPRGVQYSLDVSLFERLVQPPHLSDIRLPFSVLETQRRMHPSIAEMVRSTLYPTLQDAENVKEYPEVVGMERRLFWLNHEHLEAGASEEDPNSTSHSNDFEVEMASALVSHLVRQGTYSPEDIAVLTPYLGQLQKLRGRMAKEATFAVNLEERDIEGLEALEEEDEQSRKMQTRRAKKPPVSKTTLLRSVRLATVDNFQGEEAKIVIISLVRSNPQNRCGFLSTSNRINVLMSRAKHGCYILGNSETYRGVPMWNQIIGLLQDGGNFGPDLGLQCPRHARTPMHVSVPDHFAIFSPDGGCNVPCDRRLDCGHACYKRCHSELLHKTVKCHEKCPRPKEGCDHDCPRECGDPCEDRCNVILKDALLRLPCGHIKKSPKCWENQNPESINCEVTVERKIPECDHIVKLKCFIDVHAPSFGCNARCNAVLECGHACRSPCHRCNTREEGKIVSTTHRTCTQVCGRKFTTCPHTCQQPCHGKDKCAPCTAPCEVRCSHSRCSKPCHEPCAPCAEGHCASRCPHARCSMPCAAPCDWVPCSKRCSLSLGCGHQCPSMCGEVCPDPKYCQQCGSQDVLSTVVDYLEMAEYKDIDLDKDPCIFPDCGHFLTTTSMDGQMSMAEHYSMDADGRPVSIETALKPFSMDEVKVCPQCRGSLRNISRYGRIVRRAMLDEATKKFVAWSNDRYLQLAERLVQEQQAWEGRHDRFEHGFGGSGPIRLVGDSFEQISFLSKWIESERYASLQGLCGDVTTFLDHVVVEEQPFQKVANLVRHANRQNTTSASFTFDESLIQYRGYLFASSLMVKCFILILGDFVQLLRKHSFDLEDMVVDLSRPLLRCDEIIDLSRQTDRPEHEAQGHVYSAQLCGYAVLLRNMSPSIKFMKAFKDQSQLALIRRVHDVRAVESESEKYIFRGQKHIEYAQRALEGKAWPSKGIMEAEIKAAEHMLNGGTFYRPVTTGELRAVYAAMAQEFRGTGHWYTCERGHPFTVGECGMPMEQARCPECGSAVGGLHHTPAQGVRRAEELEELGRGVGNMRI